MCLLQPSEVGRRCSGESILSNLRSFPACAGPRRFLYRQTLGRLRSEQVLLHPHSCTLKKCCPQRLLCNGQQCFQQSLHSSSNCFLPTNELKSTCPCSRRDDRIGCVQATFASAEVRAKSLAEMQQTDAAEVEKLLQRQQAAEAQYDQGLSKLRATARQLQSLASRVSLSIFCRLI